MSGTITLSHHFQHQNRAPYITPELEIKLYPYIGGIIRLSWVQVPLPLLKVRNASYGFFCVYMTNNYLDIANPQFHI